MYGRDSITPIPPRVQAAIKYLDLCHSLEHQCDSTVPAVGLTPQHQQVRRSALRVLALYFEGEMDYGDQPPTPTPTPPTDPDAPGSAPVKVNT